MKGFKYLVLTVMMVVMQTAMAQVTTVKGVLVDETTNEGEPYATVRIYSEGKAEKPVSMFLTDENGERASMRSRSAV